MEERLRHLFRRYLNNSCSREELEEFLALVQKAQHDELLRQLLKTTYNELNGQGTHKTFVDEQGYLTLTQPERIGSNLRVEKRSRLSKLLPSLGIAASTIVIAGFLWYTINPKTDSKTNTLSSITKKVTNRAESKFLLLEDSTQVWLNAASSLEYPDQFSAGKREVNLSGEAYFDVKHAEKIPFIIHTGNVSTTVLGTAFNIKAYPGQKNITISVTRGKVKVTRPNGWETTLIKGQQLKLEEEGRKGIERNVAAEEIAAWQKGSLVYDDEAMEDVVADLQRVYNVEIRIMRDSIKKLSIGTTFKREIGVAQALQVLCKLTDTEFKMIDGVYIIH
jgi:transmembrane sensor